MGHVGFPSMKIHFKSTSLCKIDVVFLFWWQKVMHIIILKCITKPVAICYCWQKSNDCI